MRALLKNPLPVFMLQRYNIYICIMGERKCKHCGNKFVKQQPLQFICSVSCSIEYARKQSEKKQKADWQKRKAVLKEKVMKKGDWEALLQTEINHIARIIDNNQVCISKQTKLNAKFDAGHRFSRGSFPSIRFNLLNIHAQSVQENRDRSGNPDGYDIGLKQIYGQEYFDMVHNLKLKYPTIHLTVEDIKEAIHKAKLLKKALIAENKVYSTQERIEKRIAINKAIGIYL